MTCKSSAVSPERAAGCAPGGGPWARSAKTTLGSGSNLVLFQSKLALLNSKGNSPGFSIVLMQQSSCSFYYFFFVCAYSELGCLFMALSCTGWALPTKQNLPHCLHKDLRLVSVSLHSSVVLSVVFLSTWTFIITYSAELLSFVWPCLCWLRTLDVHLAERAFVSCYSTFKCKKHFEEFREA